MTNPYHSGLDCFHCGLPVPAGVRDAVEIDGVERPMCCPGCCAVAELIVEQGLVDYYRHRDEPGPRVEEARPDLLAELRRFDDEVLQSEFVQHPDDESRVAMLSIEGMRCPACVWLIERRLRIEAGIESVRVSLVHHRAEVQWRPSETELSRILYALDRLGYRAQPFEPDHHEEIHRAEMRRGLRHLGIAGLGMAQVMMFAVALYAGAIEGMAPLYRELMRGVSALVTTVVIATAGRPFFEGALRDLRARHLGMDVPIAIALGTAFLASLIATATRSGEVYFDSVCMFIFFLTLARHLELRMRARSGEQLRVLARRVPQLARRLVDGVMESVSPRTLERGDIVAVAPGESIPADGLVIAGESSVNESLLTGEGEPRAKRCGDRVLAGSQNIDGALRLRVERAGTGSALSTILRLIDRAESEKPEIATLADRVARGFVTVVLLAAAGVAIYWWQHSPDDALWITLSVLVVTCPCALSLATPAALAAATNGLAGRGFLITRGHTLETLADVDHVIFDKTGTVTKETPRLEGIFPVGAIATADALAIASVLEAPSLHPLAHAIRAAGAGGELAERIEHWNALAHESVVVPNRGVEALLDGERWGLGSPSWIRECFTDAGGALPEPPGEKGSWLLLARGSKPVAWLAFSTELRRDARDTVQALRHNGVSPWLVSGDPQRSEVENVASELGIGAAIADASPEKKLSILEDIQDTGGIVAAVGDGINDAPLLRFAHVSIAMGGGADLARVSADAVLLGEEIRPVDLAIRQARRTRRVIRQNLGWALVYNSTALPLAACGWVPPWAAALGMSLSSLVVVGNALRLSRVEDGACRS